MHGGSLWGIAAILAWGAWAFFVRWLLAPGFRSGEPLAGVTVRLIQMYARLMHRASFAGRQHAPSRPPDGFAGRPLVIVANHTAGIDPILIQAALPFEVRWVMAQDMRLPKLEPFWRYGRVIFVDRQSADTSGLREAIRHLKAGGTLGIFPEGGIERPARRLLPFREGVGLMINRTGALVLPAIIEGTPQVDPAWASLWKSSRSRVRFLPIIDFSAQAPEGAGRRGVEPGAIADRLRDLFARETGWPMNEHPPKFEGGVWWFADDQGTYHPETRAMPQQEN